MFFDDRLATVLRQRAAGEGSLRTQYRQLLDLLGRDRAPDPGGDQSLLAAAWLRLDALAQAIPAASRARMIREPGWRFRNPDLAEHLADQEPEVASAALSRADLSVDDWSALIPRMPVRARGFLRLRRDLPVDVEALLSRLGVHDRGLPAPGALADRASEAAPVSGVPTPLRVVTGESREAQPAAPAGQSRDDAGRSEISALVERIAQFRRTRTENGVEHDSSPRLPLGELPERPARNAASFGFATDTTGRIVWAAPDVAPMVIGVRLFGAQAGLGTDADGAVLARAFARRQPITHGEIALAGAPAITGDWIIDAEPRFSEDGHFTGYAGRFRRAPDPHAAASSASPAAREADRIRQLLHELRTPVTAVQGYAEVIQQQLFGPAPHEYRALAAGIAADAARILAGFEELDRLARLETGAIRTSPGETDLVAILRRTTAQLNAALGTQDAGLAIDIAADVELIVGLDTEETEALVWRVLASLAAAVVPGEKVVVGVDPLIGREGAFARLHCQLPGRLAGPDNLFAATIRGADSTISPGLFGAGFALRLARAEARAAGGSLRRDKDVLLLTLPLLGGNKLARGPVGT